MNLAGRAPLLLLLLILLPPAGALAQVTETAPAVVIAPSTNTNLPVAVVPQEPEEDATETIRSTVLSLWRGFLRQLPLILAGIVVLFLTWAVAALLKKTGNRYLPQNRFRASLRELIIRLMVIAIWILGIFLSMTIMFPDITPGRALATLGLGSIAIGFAFKDIFENFFAGVLILWRFPFDPGDFIECEGIMGKVEDVTIRNTLIRQMTGELVVIPNATIFKSPVYVLTNLPHRRVTFVAGVAYGEDVDKSREVIQAAVARCQTVHKDQPIQIFAQEFAESSINFEVTWWTAPLPVDIRRSKDEVVAAVKRALDDAGIEIPFPYRTLTFKGPIETKAVHGNGNGDPREPALLSPKDTPQEG